MKLSVVIATHNEEKNIKDCLESVIKIANEIIIVDGSSTDKTREIAKKFTSKIYKVINTPHFHKNKQIGINKSKGDWILQLDADERLSPELSQEISKICHSGHSEESSKAFSAYELPRLNFFLGRFLKKGGVYPDPVIRLFKKGKGEFVSDKVINNGITTSNVHAQIQINGKIGRLKNNLIHYGDRTFDQYMKRFNRYTDLESQNLLSFNFRPNFFNALNYILFKPTYWFFMRYFRHKGFMDGYQGFVFALMSAFHYPVIYLKVKEKNL